MGGGLLDDQGSVMRGLSVCECGLMLGESNSTVTQHQTTESLQMQEEIRVVLGHGMDYWAKDISSMGVDQRKRPQESHTLKGSASQSFHNRPIRTTMIRPNDK